MKDPRSDVIRVMLVDDMRGARTGFMMMLNNAPDIIVSCQAADGAQAIGYLRESPHQLPDVLLMDVRMPVMDGIEATGIIKEEFPQIRILILTTYDEDDYAFDGLARGASGFLLKDATPRQLRDAVHAVYNGDAILTPRITGEVINRGVRTISDNARIKLLRGLFNSLSKREHEVAELVATGLSNQEISERMFIETASVRRTVSRVLAKMHMRDRVQIVIAWYQAGLDQMTNESATRFSTGNE